MSYLEFEKRVDDLAQRQDISNPAARAQERFDSAVQMQQSFGAARVTLEVDGTSVRYTIVPRKDQNGQETVDRLKGSDRVAKNNQVPIFKNYLNGDALEEEAKFNSWNPRKSGLSRGPGSRSGENKQTRRQRRHNGRGRTNGKVH